MHTLITGTTGMGKTTWAIKKAQALKKINPNRKTIVFDLFKNPDFQADYITYNQDMFLQAVWNNTNCNLFIDEGGATIGKFNTLMEQVATRGRHFGHKAYFITQRVTMIPKTIRAQCSELVTFRICQDDAKSLYNDFVRKEILEAPELEHGEFIFVAPKKAPFKANIFEM